MTAVLLAAAFALFNPPPKIFTFEKPADEVVFGLPSDRFGERIGSSKIPPAELARLQAELSLRLSALCGPITALDIVNREGGFHSGFGPLPPGTVPAVPLTSAGFWSPRDNWRLAQPGGFGTGGVGGFSPGGGRGMGGGGGLGGSGGGGGRGSGGGNPLIPRGGGR